MTPELSILLATIAWPFIVGGIAILAINLKG